MLNKFFTRKLKRLRHESPGNDSPLLFYFLIFPLLLLTISAADAEEVGVGGDAEGDGQGLRGGSVLAARMGQFPTDTVTGRADQGR